MRTKFLLFCGLIMKVVLFCGELVSQRQRYVAILATNTAFLGVVRLWDELVNVWAILPLEKRVRGKPG